MWHSYKYRKTKTSKYFYANKNICITIMNVYVLSHVWLCDPMDCSLPGSSVHGIFQARILEWVAIFSSRGISDLEIEPASLLSPELAGRFFTTVPPGLAHKKNTCTQITSKLLLIYLLCVSVCCTWALSNSGKQGATL